MTALEIAALNSPSFAPGLYLGSEDEDGRHIPDTSGWPYSVFVKSVAVGGCDMVVCHGIQDLADAERILAALALPKREG